MTSSTKSARLQLIVTPQDKEEWTARARKEGLSLNEFVRRAVNSGAGPTVVGISKLARELTSELRRFTRASATPGASERAVSVSKARRKTPAEARS